MMRIKSIVLKLLITYIIVLVLSHAILTLALYLFLHSRLTNMPLNSGDFNQIQYVFALASFISITIPGVLTYYLSRRMTAPLREMNRVALQIARGNFAQRITIKTRDEVGALGETFN